MSTNVLINLIDASLIIVVRLDKIIRYCGKLCNIMYLQTLYTHIRKYNHLNNPSRTLGP